MDFDVEDELLQVPAKFLQAPTLRYDGTTKTPTLGQWNLREGTQSVVKFQQKGSLRRIHVLELPGGLPNCTASEAHQALYDQLRGHGLALDPKITGPRIHYDRDSDADPSEDVAEFETNHVAVTANQLRRRAKQKPGDIPRDPDNLWYIRKFLNLILTSSSDCGLVVIPKKDYNLYAAAKRLADFSGRKLSFAIGSKFMRNGRFDDQFLSNLALKITLKMGGETHYLDSSGLSKCFNTGDKNIKRVKERTVVLGADVGHGGIGSRPGSPSVACVVGSVDSNMMRYPGSMRLQAGGQEIIETAELCSMVQERLRDWSEENNGAWPENMLFYRDGVSESQFAACKAKEIPAIKDAYKKLTKRDLKLTFVICGKRHNTRFYAMKKEDTYGEKFKIDGDFKEMSNGNLKPGLIVTDVITNKSPPNFFLQSHRAIKGTARSAHYHILEDGMGLKVHWISQITMQLCYAFCRATTGVSYVAPAYIADRMCERGRNYLRAWSLSPEMEPKFDPQPKKDHKGRPERMTRELLDKKKQEFAEELMQNTEIWGKNASAAGSKNPWSKSFSDEKGMFWL
ncbi:Piwi domain-containing protein [Phaeosphaeria sp. MPI-PUGE-AT-0046c]|nr:Piwi domain-containing protein [Phaeosphaeria sp. MPI-PUGE-AT-0046c]